MADTHTEPKVSYKASDMNENVDKEIERLRAQAQWGWPKEARNLGWFGLRDGMSILEVGSGPGFVTENLLTLCPHSHITCIEIDPELIPRAEQYLQSRGLGGRYTIIQGDLMNMDLPDNAFDFAVARFIFQHLPDPLGAMQEIRRVLKPGGTLSIYDVEDGLSEIFEPEDPEADALVRKAFATQEQRGGNRRIGRRLWRLLGAAGYENMDLEMVPLHSDNIAFEDIIPVEWDPGAFKPAREAGVITEADIETLHKSHLALHASPDKYAFFVTLMVCGHKPTS